MGTVLLTRVECLCGRSAAIPENGFFPLCGGCGRRMVAPGEGRVNYVSETLDLDEAVRRHAEGSSRDLRGYAGHKREYTDDTLRDVLTQRNWPTEAPDWPRVPSMDGGSHHVPPWELPLVAPQPVK